jgi:dienelactone hydrolase
MRICITLFIVFFTSLLPVYAQNTKPNLHIYEGTYEFRNGEKLTMGIFDELGGSLVYLNLKTLKVGTLVHIKDHLFRDNQDSLLLFEFQQIENNIASLKRIQNSIPEEGKRNRLHTREEITFTNNRNKLSGALYLPEGKGPHPLAVVVHPSGPATKGAAFFTTHLLQLGIGVLIFDKQGAGKSEGSWETASFDDLASDVLAAIKFAKSRNEIDQTKIGITGSSQGGWIGSMVAAKSKDLAFMIIRVGAGENVLQTITHEYKGILISKGLTPSEVSKGLQMYQRHWRAAAQGKRWGVGDSILKEYKNESWYADIVGDRSKTEGSSKWWTWLQKNLYYNSYDYLKKVKIPVLWFLAEKDWNVNTPASYARLLAAKKQSGNKDFTVARIAGASHSGMLAKTGLPNDVFTWQYAPGYWDKLEAWLKKRGFTR